MADSNDLEDFWAKKDKKKQSRGGKNPEATINRALGPRSAEEIMLESRKARKDKQNKSSAGQESSVAIAIVDVNILPFVAFGH